MSGSSTLAWPTLGEYCPDIKRELFLGMQAICFGGGQTKPFAITRHYNGFASSKPQTSILSLGKNCSVFLPSSSTCQHSLRSKFSRLFPRETLRQLAWLWLPLHISIARFFSSACRTCCQELLDIGSCHNHSKKHWWWLVHFSLSHESRLLYWTKSRPLESAK